MILSDKEIIGIKNYAELIGKLRLIAVDMHWPLLEDAASTIDELRRDAERYRWLRSIHNGGDEMWFVYVAKSDDLDTDIDAAIKESK